VIMQHRPAPHAHIMRVHVHRVKLRPGTSLAASTAASTPSSDPAKSVNAHHPAGVFPGPAFAAAAAGGAVVTPTFFPSIAAPILIASIVFFPI